MKWIIFQTREGLKARCTLILPAVGNSWLFPSKLFYLFPRFLYLSTFRYKRSKKETRAKGWWGRRWRVPELHLQGAPVARKPLHYQFNCLSRNHLFFQAGNKILPVTTWTHADPQSHFEYKWSCSMQTHSYRDLQAWTQVPTAAILPSKHGAWDTRKSSPKKAQNQTKTVRKQNTYSSEHSNWSPPWCAQQISAYLSLLQLFSTSSLFGTSHLNPHYHGLLAAMQSPDRLSLFSI